MAKEITNDWTPLIRETMTSLFGGWLVEQYNDKSKTIFPIRENVFKAFKLTPLQNVKVVILGQDPYHGCQVKHGQAGKNIVVPEANGLAFSVNKNVATPPSLKNVFTAIENDLGIKTSNPNLVKWAEQGVLLLNTALTVEMDKPGSHAKAWRDFMKRVFFRLNKHPNKIIFLLWGSKAQSYKKFIDPRHIILEAPHPSPFSAHKGFLTCKHFSEVNRILEANGQSPINWKTDDQEGQ